jgi:hypothetical protein
MSFRSVFLAVVIAFGLIVAAFLLNRARPRAETDQPSADLVSATGKCAECHARTQYYGFFNLLEWVPVVVSAIAVGFLVVPLFMRVSRPYVDLCVTILLLEAGVGLWGFVLHAASNLRGPSIHAFDNFIYGAPPMAPLLFPNLMVLGVIALWGLRTNPG